MAMLNNQMVILVCDANYGRLSITSPPGCSSLIRWWHRGTHRVGPPMATPKKTWLRPVDAWINPKYSIKYQSTSWFFGYWYFEKPKMIFFSETRLATSLASTGHHVDPVKTSRREDTRLNRLNTPGRTSAMAAPHTLLAEEDGIEERKSPVPTNQSKYPLVN